MSIFLHSFQDGRPHFIAEYNVQQVRKLVLEMVQRLPANDFLKPYVKQILSLVFKLLEVRRNWKIVLGIGMKLRI